MKSSIQQYKPNTSTVFSSGGLTGTQGEVKFSIFGKSPFGRTKGKIVHEYKANGIPFTGNNSTSSTGSGSFTNTSVTITQLSNDETGLLADKEYKWRARVQYDLISNPYQKFGPWKYYNSYTPVPPGNFRPTDGLPIPRILTLRMFIQGFYEIGTGNMVTDTVTVLLRNSSPPYAVIDSVKGKMNSSGEKLYSFINGVNGVNYFIELKHRNFIETWSKTPQTFTANALTYKFKNSLTQEYGDNIIQIDTSTLKFGIYSGDVNQDGSIDLADITSVFNAASSFTTGYVVNDLSGDNIVDLSDLTLVFNNSSGFVAKVIP